MSNSHRKKHLPPPPLAEVMGDPRDAPQASEQPAAPPADVLGTLPAGPYDTGLKVNQSHVPPPAQPASADALRLPRGALVAMRRSGGFKFRSRAVVVYRDGRVNYDDGESGPRTVWTLSETELAELRGLIEQAGLANMPAAGRQNPDAFAYEIVARPARRAYTAEVFQGSIPSSVVPLIKRLNQLAGMDEGAPAGE
jgi:hypothetical protein